MNVNKADNNTNNTTRFAQTQVHLPMYDNGHENGNSGSSANAEPSAATRSHGREISNLSARSPSTASSSSPTPASTAPGSQPQSSRKPYTHSMTNDQNNPSSLNDSTTPNIKNQLHLEQQIKMSQLQQLQQLQNHIFQQQMALISGQPTSMSTILQGSTSSEFIGIGGVGSIGNIGPVGIPIDLNAVAGVGHVRPLQSLHDTQQNLSQSLQQSQDQQQQNNHGEAQNGPHTFSGLHTPAPSGEIRPMDYNAASPPMLNLLGSLNLQYIEPLPNSMIPASSSSTRSSSVSTPSTSFQQLNSQRLGHRHSSSSSVHNHHSHASYPSSPLTFDQNSVTSPTFHPISPVQIPTSHPYQPSSNSYHSTSHPTPHLASQIHSYPSSSTSTPISAPPSASERLAFTIYGSNNHRSGGSVHATPHSHPNNSVHASPNVLGSGIASINGVSGGRGLETVQTLLDLDLDQDISPLTSPWLGATVAASGGTAISTSVSVASGAVIQKRDLSAKRTSISRNKRTASESGDEGGGTNRNSRKRPVLGNGGRMGSLTGSVGLHAAATSGLVGGERRETDGKVRDSTHLLARNSTSPANEIASPTTPAVDPPIRGRGGDSGHLSRGPSQPSATQASTPGSSISRRTRTGSRSTDTPFVRPAPLTTNLSSPMTPLSPVLASGGGDPLGKGEGRRSRVGDGGQGQERESPSPVDLNLEAGQGQDGKSGRSMPPPPLARGGMDIDMNPTEPTTPMDDSCGHLQHGMLDMGGMEFDGIMSLHEGVTGMVGIGMGGLDGMGISVDGYGMGGMDMSGIGSMEGIAGMGMEEMDMGMSVNMGGMAGFGGGHEHSHHRREELGIMSMDYERNNDTISTTASTGRSITGSAAATHHQHQSQSHIHPHSDYQRIQPHLSPAQPQHQQQSQTPSHPHSLHIQLQTDHQISNQLGQNQPNQQQSRMPVATPSSMLNLGRLGVGSAGRLGSALSASTSTGANKAPSNGSRTGVLTRAKKATKASKEAGGSSTGAAARRRSLTTSAVASSPGLKPLRPAAAASESTLPSPALTGSVGSSASTSKATSSISSTAASTGVSVTATPALSPADAIGVIRQPKRTHRDAEQRRRNSQKQVIDDLRRLLPPIALPSDSNANNNGDSDPTSPAGPTPGISPFFFQPTATLLPGGLPPRGPPKTGGEGPNKNVSKLQVLLCGNEYIKLLKARVERRDEEIWRLRREIKRLRAVRGGRLVDEDDMGRVEDEVDLEKDLDADERHMIAASKGAGSSAAGSSVQGGGMRGGGDDVMDEDEDEDGDDD